MKIALAVHFGDLPPHYDETEFLAYGNAIASEGSAPNLWRAPGYQTLVAIGLSVAGGRPVGVRILQVLLSVAACLLVYRIARRRGGERAGFWAGTFVCFYPSHVAFSHLLWSETLYGFLLLAAVDRLLAADRTGRLRPAILAGVLFGLTALTRSLGLALLAVSALWLWRFRGDRLAAAAALVGAAVLVVLPWSIHASGRAGRLVVVDVNAGFNLWSGNNEHIPPDVQGIWSVGLPLDADMGSRLYDFLPDSAWRPEIPWRMGQDGVTEQLGPDGEIWYRERGLRTIREDPLAFVARIPRKVAALWAPDFFLPRHVLRDWYGPAPPALAAMLLALTWVAAAVPLIAGPVALGAMRADRFRSLLALFVLVTVAAHSLAYGHSRMHQPLVPLLVIAVAIFLLDRDEAPDRRRLLAIGAPWGAVALVLWIFAFPIVAGLYVLPNARHASVVRVLALGRHLPLPGTPRLSWMLANVELASGRREAAGRILAADDHPWSLFLRAWSAPDPVTAEPFLREALARDPDLYPAVESLAWIRRRRGDEAEARELLQRARDARPWSAFWLDQPRVLPVATFPPSEWERAR